ncbi:MAG: alpha/beta fold hydrolase [Pseudomonadales bacterium]|nr:alpha/beta fold hydrolase [Pseudomonadales bacterium]
MTKKAILIHGLGRSALAMRSLATLLRAEGYQVSNLDYPSTRMGIPALVEQYLIPVFSQASDAQQIDVVTHSLGGILFRYYLANHATEDVKSRMGRTVMLAPPNHGSHIPDHLKRWSVARWIMGPAMGQLSSDVDSIPNQLASRETQGFPCDIGVIAGTRSYEPWFWAWMVGPNDGKVSVESARLRGMKDFIQLKVGHTYIMESKVVRRQLLHFFQHGKFNH